jgi:hypothetical protein
MTDRISIIAYEDKYYELVMLIEQAGWNQYILTMTIMGNMFRVNFPLIGRRRTTFFEVYKLHKQNRDCIDARIKIINRLFEQEVFLPEDAIDDPDLVRSVFRVIRREIVPTHFKDKSTGEVIVPKIVHQAIQLAGYNPMNPAQAIKLIKSDGSTVDPLAPIDPEEQARKNRRKMTL